MPPNKVIVLLFFISSTFAACPPGTIYESFFNKCYKFFPQPAVWLTAEKSCESLGGNLVAVSNAFENTYIHGIAGEAAISGDYWIGSSLLLSSQWSWINGDTSGYFNWAAELPSDPSIYECAAVRATDSFWIKGSCNTAKPYMCQIDPNSSSTDGCSSTIATPVPIVTSAPPTVEPDGPCHSGYCTNPSYILNPETCKCYKMYTDPLNYTAAAEICSNENATMAVIMSPADNKFLVGIVNSINCPGIRFPFIGIWCTGNSTASCEWIDGSPLGYTNFGNDGRISPAIYSNMPTYLNNYDSYWYGDPNSFDRYYICQQRGIPTPRTSQLCAPISQN